MVGGNDEDRSVSCILAFSVATVSSTEFWGEAFWLLRCSVLACTRKGVPTVGFFFFQKEVENASGEQGNEGAMAALSYRATQGFNHVCVEAGLG